LLPSPGPLLDRGLDAAEPHIRLPLVAAGTKIPHARRRRARKGGTNLYRGVSQPGRYAVRPPGSAGIDRLPRRWLELDGLARRSGRLQHRTLRHLPVRQVAPERDHVLDNVAQTAPDLVLILSREGLRPARRRAETTPAEPSSPPRSRRSAGQGGDDGPAACDEPAAQPGGGLRAAARWSGRSRGRVRASPAAPLASGPGAPEDAAEGGGV